MTLMIRPQKRVVKPQEVARNSASHTTLPMGPPRFRGLMCGFVGDITRVGTPGLSHANGVTGLCQNGASAAGGRQ